MTRISFSEVCCGSGILNATLPACDSRMSNGSKFFKGTQVCGTSSAGIGRSPLSQYINEVLRSPLLWFVIPSAARDRGLIHCRLAHWYAHLNLAFIPAFRASGPERSAKQTHPGLGWFCTAPAPLLRHHLVRQLAQHHLAYLIAFLSCFDHGFARTVVLSRNGRRFRIDLIERRPVRKQ